mmetsp:Transcript_2774/g.5000  ORF Transcript_2774/g.5000 Transcript_2774/m.5000 type:complete len:326 (-) Transcript_2774:621-1598(-)
MDERPESPGGTEGGPLGGTDVGQDVLGRTARERADDGGVGGVQEDGPDGQVGGHLDAGRPPRAVEIEVRLHEEKPEVTERTVHEEAGGAGPEGTWQVERGEGLALVDLGDEIAEAVGDAGRARLVEDGIGRDECFVLVDEVEGEAGEEVDGDGELGHVGGMRAEVVLPQGGEGSDVGVGELVHGRKDEEGDDGGVDVEDVVDVLGPLGGVQDAGASARGLHPLKVELVRRTRRTRRTHQLVILRNHRRHLRNVARRLRRHEKLRPMQRSGTHHHAPSRQRRRRKRRGAGGQDGAASQEASSSLHRYYDTMGGGGCRRTVIDVEQL